MTFRSQQFVEELFFSFAVAKVRADQLVVIGELARVFRMRDFQTGEHAVHESQLVLVVDPHLVEVSC